MIMTKNAIKNRFKRAKVLFWEKMSLINDVFFCENCGCLLTESTKTIDHILSQSKHPELANDPKNFVPCCFLCNQGKGDSDKPVTKRFNNYPAEFLSDSPIASSIKPKTILRKMNKV